jgi:hypothetical protein
MTTPADPDKRVSRGVSFDISPAAIEHRLERVRQLYEVWLLLRTAKRLGPVVGGSAPDAGLGEPVRPRGDT